jgi:sugar/nucleoside kinase (ribokinase family)
MNGNQVVVVAGVCNVEVTCPVRFPVEFTSSRFSTGEIEIRVSGVAYNVALGLARLGTPVRLATFLGSDLLSSVIRREIEANIGLVHISPCDDSPRSVVMYSEDGRRSVITDLRDVASRPELAHVNPEEALVGTRLLAIGNIVANRGLIAPAQVRGIPIATDLHSVRSGDDPHNVPFLRAANIVFMSNENFIDREAELLQSCRA